MDAVGFEPDKLELDIQDGHVDLITLDSWLTSVFVRQSEKLAKQRKWKNGIVGLKPDDKLIR